MEKTIFLSLDGNVMAKLPVKTNTTLKDILNSTRIFLEGRGVVTENYNIYIKLNEKEEIPSNIINNHKYENVVIYPQVGSNSFLIMTRIFTGDKNLDYLILEKLDDKDLFNVCKINKYGYLLCKNEMFWKKRNIERFGETNSYIPSYSKKTWKQFYLENVMNYETIKDKLKEEFEYLILRHGRFDAPREKKDEFISKYDKELNQATKEVHNKIFYDEPELAIVYEQETLLKYLKIKDIEDFFSVPFDSDEW